MPQPLKIIFADKDIMVLDKSANIPTDQSSTQNTISIEEILKKQYNSKLERGGIVHRLDKDTSGCLVVAKTKQSLENLQSQFKERKTKKEYLALVHGLVEDKGRVEGNIGRNPGNREKFMVMEKEGSPRFAGEAGKEAVTEYEPVKNLQFTIYNLQFIFPDFNKIQMRKLRILNYERYTLLNCQPLTGRTHQIRVHLKYINHPVVSDEKYTGRKMYRLDHRWCPRQFLHARSIAFYHPVSGEWVKFESELPEDLRKALNYLHE